MSSGHAVPVGLPVGREAAHEALLAPQRRPRRAIFCCSKACRCHLLVALLALLVGLLTGAVGTGLLMHSLTSSGEGDVIEPCPGRCENAKLDGTFVANVSRSKSILGKKIWVRFLVTHQFNSKSGTGIVHVDPYQSPFSLLQPFTCADVPIKLGSGCNISFADECTLAADKKNDVVAWSYRWDGKDSLQVAESISTPFFKDRYVWIEQRVNSNTDTAVPAM